MRIKNDELKNGELPTIISDLNGKIVFVNSRAATEFYPIKTGDSVSKFIDLDYVRKISIFDKKIDVVVPKTSKYEKLVVKMAGSGATKTIELYFAHSEKDSACELEKDKRLFSTYGEIVNAQANESAKLNDFLSRIVKYMHSDLRFAYRKFEIIEADNNSDMYANYAHLSALAVGTIVALNEIEYRNPIQLSLQNIFGEYALSFSVNVNTFVSAEGLRDFAELYPQIAMRLVYLTSLCDDDGIRYKFVVKPNRVEIKFVITNLVNKTGRFGYATFGVEPSAFVSYLMDIFSPYEINDTLEETQE